MIKKQFFNVDVRIFGSIETGLVIENSDIDLVVINKSNFSILKDLNEKLRMIWNIQFISTATVPVIKIYGKYKIDIIEDFDIS